MEAYSDEEVSRSGNYLVKHWRGDLSLEVSYWVNAVLISFIVPIALGFLVTAAEMSGASIQITASSVIAVLILSVLLSIWAIVGTWRSADHHQDRGGSAFWAGVAKFLMFLGALRLVSDLVNLGPYIGENANLAAGYDPMGPPAVVSIDNDDIKVSGVLSLGTAKRFQDSLTANPNVKRLVIHSTGGRLGEAAAMSALVTDRSLSTLADKECSSACTMILVSGRDRSTTARTKIGFHRPSFPGLASGQIDASASLMAEAYRDAGIADAFVNEALSVGAETMWYPDEAQLFKVGVLNFVHPERIAVQFAAEAQNATRKLPQAIDEITTLQSVSANGQVLTYRYVVNAQPGTISESQARKTLINDFTSDLCARYLVSEILASGGRYRFIYDYSSGGRLTDFTIENC